MIYWFRSGGISTLGGRIHGIWCLKKVYEFKQTFNNRSTINILYKVMEHTRTIVFKEIGNYDFTTAMVTTYSNSVVI